VSLPQHLARVVAIDPSAPAIEFARRWHTWGEVGDRARELAAALDDAGLPEGAPIGLVLRNDPALVSAIVAVLTTRRCIVTLSPHAGPERLARELEQLALPVIVGTAEDALRDGVRGAEILSIDSEKGIQGSIGVRARSCSPRPGVAIEMLTSGTTGRPKRVPLTFASLEQSLLGAKHYEKDASAEPRLRSGVAIINAPLVHVGGIWRVLQCLADGRAFALLPRFDLVDWVDAVRRHEPKTVSLVPAALRMVMAANVDRHDLASIRAVISGTAPLAAEEAEQFEERYGIPVLTSYGATEFAGGVAGWNLEDHRALRREKRGSVGRAHPGCQLRVVDRETGAVLGQDEPGLLEVQSAQLGPHSGWVRTTDLARIDADGFLYILGRADAAIIRGGFKVHPDAVKAALEEHPDVAEAAVVGIPDARLGHVPVAAVTLANPGAKLGEAELRAFAKSRLAAYEVPERILVVDELPRTPSLKVSGPDVAALFAKPASS
jgi:long-chain acyl-CoA synthetase